MKKLYIASMALVALCTSSCMDFYPKTALSEDQVWTSAENFQLYANQFYSWRAAMGTLTSSDDFDDSYLNSDLATGSGNSEYETGTNTLETSSSNYSTPYTRIYDASLLLDAAENYSNQDEIAVPIAEAKFFRAIEYYNLVRVYGDVILVTRALDTDSPEHNAERNDRTEVIDQALSDLWDAADLLPEESTATGKINKYIVLSILSRIALFEGTWQKFHTSEYGGGDTTKSNDYLDQAIEAAGMVINSGKYELFYSEALTPGHEKDAVLAEHRTRAGIDLDAPHQNESYRVLFHLEDDIQSNVANLNKSANNEFIWAYTYVYGYKNTSVQGLLSHTATQHTRKMAMMYLCDNGLPAYYNGQQNPRFLGFDGIYDEYQNRDVRMESTFINYLKPYWRYQCGRTSWTDDEYTTDGNSSASGAYMYTPDNVNASGSIGYLNYKWTSERAHLEYYQSFDFPIIRYPEVLLNYAEAVYERNGSITDAQLDYSLNVVRLRMNPDMPALSNTLVSTYGLDMQEEIRRERAVELVLECRRGEDIRRWAIATEVMNEPKLGVKYLGTDWEQKSWEDASFYYGENLYSEDDYGCILRHDPSELHWSDKNYLKPIPTNQIQLNPNLGQNPGW